MKPAKVHIQKRFEEIVSQTPNLKILEIGSGKSLVVRKILEKHPDLDYVGVEPIANSMEVAKEALKNNKNAKIFHSFFSKDFVSINKFENSFDLVFSLSVLEHVKYLDDFLKLSVQCLKPGGLIYHLYDLGHSLYPSSLKEKIQVIICNNAFTRKYVPHHKIASYVDLSEIKKLLEHEGIKIEKVTFHNLSSNVMIIKKWPQIFKEEMVYKMSEEEVQVSSLVPDNEVKYKEKLFPSICIWGKKKMFLMTEPQNCTNQKLKLSML